MTMLRLKPMVAVIPVMVSAFLLVALAAPAAAQPFACVHLQVGSGYAATMQINYEDSTGFPGLKIGPSNTFDIGQTQCLSLQFVPDDAVWSVQVNAELGDSTICTPSNIPRSPGSPITVTFMASGTVRNVHCDMPTAGSSATQ
jgi:hypothetical protein